MHRHEALQDLSRDHYHALIHCQQVRWAAEGHARAQPLADATRDFLAFFHGEGLLHFSEEEEVLLPILSRHTRPSESPDVLRMLDDHAWIRDALDRLERQVEAGEEYTDLAAELAQRIDDHARLEERVIFEHAQDRFTDADFKDLARRSQAFRLRWRGAASIGAPGACELPARD